MSDRPKFWSSVVGLMMGVIGLVTFLMGGVSRWPGSMGEVGLPATYGSPAWRRAKPEDDDWGSPVNSDRSLETAYLPAASGS